MLARCAAIAIVVGLTTPAPNQPADLEERVMERLAEQHDAIVELRRDLHRNPELSGQEVRTSRIVADRLAALGLEIRRGVGGHGVIAVLRGEKPGPVVGFRSDMDAVRSPAPDPVAFASETPGVRHICGHDIHTAIGVALAEGLVAVRGELAGSVVFYFQPAEESATGARAMLADGALDGARPEALLAFHTAPFEVGQLATARTVMMPGRDALRLTVSGGSNPEGVAQEAAGLLQSLTTVASPLANQPIGTDFISAVTGSGRGRETDTWVANATVTTATRTASANARARAEAITATLRDHYLDARFELSYEEDWIAGVTNDEVVATRAVASARRIVGDGGVTWLQSMVPAFSEDFGSFQAEVPGVMFFLGVSNAEKGWVGMPHSAGYVADEEALLVGARVAAAWALDLLMAATP